MYYIIDNIFTIRTFACKIIFMLNMNSDVKFPVKNQMMKNGCT